MVPLFLLASLVLGCGTTHQPDVVAPSSDAPVAPSEQAQEGLLRCSFCGKSQQEVQKLIAGPSVYICDECVELCSQIIEDDALLADEPEPSAE